MEKYQDGQIKKHEAEQKYKEEEFEKVATAHRDRWMGKANARRTRTI
ncbi:hypothetical protein [Bacillus pseudomycoides]|nr:hypothetical protein [Bacillus pseudomycoides]